MSHIMADAVGRRRAATARAGSRPKAAETTK